jgi:hypothetical protein
MAKVQTQRKKWIRGAIGARAQPKEKWIYLMNL